MHQPKHATSSDEDAIIEKILNDPQRVANNYAQGQFFFATGVIDALYRTWYQGDYMSKGKQEPLTNEKAINPFRQTSCSTYLFIHQGKVTGITSSLDDMGIPITVQATPAYSPSNLLFLAEKLKRSTPVKELKPYIQPSEDTVSWFDAMTSLDSDPSCTQSQKSTVFDDLDRFPLANTLYINYHFFNTFAPIFGGVFPTPKDQALRVLLFDETAQHGIQGFLQEAHEQLTTEEPYHGLTITKGNRQVLTLACLLGAIKAARPTVNRHLIERLLREQRITFEADPHPHTRTARFRDVETTAVGTLFPTISSPNPTATLSFVHRIHRLLEIKSRFRRQKQWIIGSIVSLAGGMALSCLIPATLAHCLSGLSTGSLYGTLAALLCLTLCCTIGCATQATRLQPADKYLSLLSESDAKKRLSSTQDIVTL